jgi:hypothetical protein
MKSVRKADAGSKDGSEAILRPVTPEQLELEGGSADKEDSSSVSHSGGSDSEDEQGEIRAGGPRHRGAGNAARAGVAADEDMPDGNDFLHLNILGTPLTLAVLNGRSQNAQDGHNHQFVILASAPASLSHVHSCLAA